MLNNYQKFLDDIRQVESFAGNSKLRYQLADKESMSAYYRDIHEHPERPHNSATLRDQLLKGSDDDLRKSLISDYLAESRRALRESRKNVENAILDDIFVPPGLEDRYLKQ